MEHKKTGAGLRSLLTAPNVCTLVRIAGTAGLLFVRPLSAAFFVLYTVSGVSDMLDGLLARRLGLVSDIGARLDSAADLMFYAVMIIRLFPELRALLPAWMWGLVAAALLLRLSAYLVAAFKYRRFASLHTWLNKLTGLAVFLLPYVLPWRGAVWYCAATCAVGVLSSGEELLIHIVSPEYRAGGKCIFETRGRAKKEQERDTA